MSSSPVPLDTTNLTQIAVTKPAGPPAPVPDNQLVRAAVPAILQLQPDLVRQQYQTGRVPTIRLIPSQASANPQVNAAAQTQAIAQQSSGSPALLLEVNGNKNATQTVLNLVEGDGITLSSDLTGDVTITGSATTIPVLSDNFLPYLSSTAAGTGPSSQIGQLGWQLGGSAGNNESFMGGQLTNLGQYGWANSASADVAGWLYINSAGNGTSGTWYQSGLALGESDSWTATWIFKVERPLTVNTTYDITGKALYVGLCGPTLPAGFSHISRPDVFIGVRYDTTTGLADTTFVLEAVGNLTYSSSARHNTQGTTLVTAIAPVAGVWHTLNITYAGGGALTLTLDGTATLSTTLPTITVTTSSGDGVINAGQAAILLSAGSSGTNGALVWGTGSTITVSGFTSTGAVLNGTNTLYFNNGGTQMYFDTTLGNVNTGGGQSISVSGYPQLVPFAMFGNDGTVASPTANTALLVVDYFSLV